MPAAMISGQDKCVKKKEVRHIRRCRVARTHRKNLYSRHISLDDAPAREVTPVLSLRRDGRDAAARNPR
jgi:hypothetical protein